MSLYPVFLAALVVGLAVADEGQQGGLFGGRLAGIAEPRLAANAIRIVQLEKHIEKLKKRIEEAEHVDPEGFLHELQARLDDLEDPHCEEHEFQCGTEECISDLLVCDGHDDCHNKEDENDDVCTVMPVKAGHVLRGMVHWKDCLIREDHLLTVHIVSTRRFKFFQARVVIRAIVTSVFKDDEGNEVTKEIPMHGGYNFANKRFRLFPDEHGPNSIHRVISCDFDSGDAERADCIIETELTMHECATVHLQLEEDEDDDDDD
jgi:hypothetical protein